MGVMTYQYTDPEDGAVLSIEGGDDEADQFAYVRARTRTGSSHVIVCVRPDERQAAAQALAGDEYRVVPVGRKSDDAIREPDTWAVDQATCVKCAWHSQNRPEPVEPSEIRDTNQTLLWLLRRAGDEWGPLGVAIVAAELTDPEVLIQRLRAQPEPDPATEALRAAWNDAMAVVEYGGGGWDPEQMVRELAKRGVSVEVPDA